MYCTKYPNGQTYLQSNSILSDLGVSISEVIIFENLRKAAERISELEDLDEDRWSTVAYLCSNFEKLEKSFKELEKENQKLKLENEKLNTQITQLKKKLCANHGNSR